MKKALAILLIFIVLLLDFHAVIAERGTEMEDIRNDQVPLACLDMQEYALEDMLDFFEEKPSLGLGLLKESSLTLAEVNDRFPLEILRRNRGCYYSVYKISEGGYYYVFWNLPISTDAEKMSIPEDSIVYFSVYINNRNAEEVFDRIRIGIDSAADVYTIDPSMELNLLLSSSICSYSLLDDGAILEFRYIQDEDSSEFSLENLRIIDRRCLPEGSPSASCLGAILQADLP